MTRLAPLALCLIACAPEEEPEPQDTSVVTEEVAIGFTATMAGNPVVCGSTYAGMGSTRVNAIYEGLRFYVHDVRVIFDDGTEAMATLDADGTWQDGDIALIDLEDGPPCAGDAATNAVLSVEVPVERGHTSGEGRTAVRGLQFVMGVPFDANHQGVATSAPPLDRTDMHVNATTGNYFMRLDLVGGNGQAWPVYLTSLGCTAMPNEGPTCADENLVTHTIADWTPDAPDLVLDLDVLLARADLSKNSQFRTDGGVNLDTPDGCQSDPNDPDCTPIFVTYGTGDDLPTYITLDE